MSLQVGLTGGIGSGKSTVAAELVALGAVLVDSDRLAREVVGPGTAGLAQVVATFGPAVLTGDGDLDRAALAAVVFAEPAARARLEAITHPLIRAAAQRAAAAAIAARGDTVVVHDVPLLVERGLGAGYDLVIVVHAPAEQRLARLVVRGLGEADARARMAAQADDVRRRAAADLWLDNGSGREQLVATVAGAWHGRLLPFEANLRTRRCAVPPERVPAGEPADGAVRARIAARVTRLTGAEVSWDGRGTGQVAVPAGSAGVARVAGVAGVAGTRAGIAEQLSGHGFPAGAAPGCHGSADPGRPVRLHLDG